MPNKLSEKQVQDIIQWDVKNWRRALSFWEENFEIKPGMRVLALGERGGGISLFFALKGCEVVCTDYRNFPDTTVGLHKSYGVSEHITYAEQVDMRSMNFPDESFDIVVFKSVIGALESLEDQERSLKEIYRVLKKGGAFLFAENSTASFLHRAMRKMFVKWEAKWRYVPDSDFETWKKEYSVSFAEKRGFAGVFGRTESQRKILGYIDGATSFFIPPSWKYIYFGVCVKWGVSSSRM